MNNSYKRMNNKLLRWCKKANKNLDKMVELWNKSPKYVEKLKHKNKLFYQFHTKKFDEYQNQITLMLFDDKITFNEYCELHYICNSIHNDLTARLTYDFD